MRKLAIISLFALHLLGCTRVELPASHHFELDTLTHIDIAFSGDFMQHMPQVNAAQTPQGFDYKRQLRHIAPFWKSADFAVINLETTLSSGNSFSGYPMFASPHHIAAALRRAGVTHTALANNHAMDKGRAGVYSTIGALDSAGLISTGVYTSAADAETTTFLVKGKLKVALLNYTYGTNGMPVPVGVWANATLDTARIGHDIDLARQRGATHIVFFVHYGQEYNVKPDAAQQSLALWARQRGADLVVGSHPHVPQPIDNERCVIYSLGNFVSNQRNRYTDGGYSVKVRFYEWQARPTIQYLPHFVDLSSDKATERYRVLTPSDGAQIRDSAARARFHNSIDDTRRIIKEKVEYDL